MSTLYIVSTPIGNLKDITLRALEILKEVDLIACEDTRRTSILLNHCQIKKPLLSYFEHNEERRIPELVRKLETGEKIALVSDSGTPLLSDPGFKLVRECIKRKIKVEAIPGASAVLCALVSSGLPTDKFIFLGYLPKKKGKRIFLLESLATVLLNIVATVVIFESPYKLLKTLEDLKGVFGDINIVIARELTKVHEEIRREKISEAQKNFQKIKPRGEFTLLFSV